MCDILIHLLKLMMPTPYESNFPTYSESKHLERNYDLGVTSALTFVEIVAY